MIGVVPVQVPAAACSEPPERNTPVIDGATVFAGALAVTMAVCVELVLVPPALLEAVTLTASREPMSAAVATYVGLVASGMGWHAPPAPGHRCHW